MPLISTNRPMTLIDGEHWSVGVLMQIADSAPVDFVWVVATYECVEDLDHPYEIADRSNAIKIADSNRAVIEKAASAKFDKNGINPDDGAHEKEPILRLHSYDLPG